MFSVCFNFFLPQGLKANHNPTNLDVNRSVNLTGTLKINNGTGSNLQALSRNSAAALEWRSIGNIINSYASGYGYCNLLGSTSTDLVSATLTIT